MASQLTRAPYKGVKPALVIAIDVGTTFSGASYSILTPNEIPAIVDVIGFKGQEDKSSSTKVPSILFYDSTGRLLACGSEAEDTIIDDEGFVRVEWFKLLLRPLSLGISLDSAPDARLPPGKSVVDVFGDFLRYMRGCVRDYLIETEDDGATVWANLEGETHYVLTHPNGWEGFQQVQMRDAAILGGLIPDNTSSHNRIEFVTEGEASFHWCVDIGLAKSVLKLNAHVIVADAGGGTIDVSSFRVASMQPLRLQETAAAECRLAGSIFVTQAFKDKIEDKLRLSPYGTDEYIERATEEFDKKTKCLFRDRSNAALIRLGSRKDNDAKNSIKMGQITLTGDFLADTFEKSCAGATEAIRVQLTKKQKTKATVYLVGGFAASPWLHSELQRRLANDNVEIKRADSHTSKAVAHGAIAFYLDNYITSRIAKHTYGTLVIRPYDQSSLLHRQRAHSSVICPITGTKQIEGGFYAIVKKGDTIKADAVYRSSLIIPTRARDSAIETVVTLRRYIGTRKSIEFYDEDSASSFQPLCTFRATVPPAAFEVQNGLLGQYWIAPFDIVMNLGTSELTCHVEWRERGQTKRGIAASVWEDI